jgi:oxygen-independent coproporphyrinogen III oxidase
MKYQVTFDSELLRRYEQPGPRYISYPAAAQFATSFGEQEFRRHALLSNEDLIPRSLSLYLHVPYCTSPCFYCGCNRILSEDIRKARPYVERLIREIEQVGRLFARDREVLQVQLGGGTPNFLSTVEIGDLMGSLRRHFQLSARADRDFAIELDPREVREGDIGAYAAQGFTRASLGVYDFDLQVQRAINREQCIDATFKVIEQCRSHGMRSLNLDLVYGLPKQTEASFARTLETVLWARPGRVSISGYAHAPQVFKMQRQFDAGDLPSTAVRVALLQMAVQQLTAAGYRYIGMDHFALPEDDLARAQASGGLHRNFLGYTTHADCDLIGFGANALSHVGDSVSQSPEDLPDWEAAVDRGELPVWRGLQLDFDDIVRGDVIQQLMCRGEVDIAAVEDRYEIDFAGHFAAALARLAELAADGLVQLSTQRITATSRGRLLLRSIAMCFDRYFQAAQHLEGRASQVCVN